MDAAGHGEIAGGGELEAEVVADGDDAIAGPSEDLRFSRDRFLDEEGAKKEGNGIFSAEEAKARGDDTGDDEGIAPGPQMIRRDDEAEIGLAGDVGGFLQQGGDERGRLGFCDVTGELHARDV